MVHNKTKIPKKRPQIVYVLSIMFPTGTDFYVFSNKAAAYEQLYDYVQEYWDDEFIGEDIPIDRMRAIKDFFQDNEEHSYVLTDQRVLDDAVTH